MEAVIHRYQIQQLIIGIHEIEPQKKNDIVAICFEHQVSVKSVPPVANWINGQLSLKQLKKQQAKKQKGKKQRDKKQQDKKQQSKKKTSPSKNKDSKTAKKGNTTKAKQKSKTRK